MTIQEKACNFETMQHIQTVQKYINFFIKELISRAEEHDQSKLEEPELALFTEHTEKLAKLTYDSPEYKESLELLGPALTHHYAKNRHHPQHFKNGVNDMTLIDIVEMFCDWKAATARHHDGNLRKSIEKNAKRFDMSNQLEKIFENTAEVFDA